MPALMDTNVADIEGNLAAIHRRIVQAAERGGRTPEDVTLVAISKTFSAEAIRNAISLGVAHVGENRVQEAAPKVEQMRRWSLHPVWHMVGHLQSNKVRTALDLFDIIQSVDSVHLAEAISRRADRPVKVLLEVNAADEATKSGFTVEELLEYVGTLCRLPNLDVRGLMTVAPLVSDPEDARPVFRQLRELRDRLGLRELSMGMTDDFEVAIEEGATIVRLGRAVFGSRRADNSA